MTLISWGRMARGFRTAADGDLPSLSMTPRPMRSGPGRLADRAAAGERRQVRVRVPHASEEAGLRLTGYRSDDVACAPASLDATITGELTVREPTWQRRPTRSIAAGATGRAGPTVKSDRRVARRRGRCRRTCSRIFLNEPELAATADSVGFSGVSFACCPDRDVKPRNAAAREVSAQHSRRSSHRLSIVASNAATAAVCRMDIGRD